MRGLCMANSQAFRFRTEGGICVGIGSGLRSVLNRFATYEFENQKKKRKSVPGRRDEFANCHRLRHASESRIRNSLGPLGASGEGEGESR